MTLAERQRSRLALLGVEKHEPKGTLSQLLGVSADISREGVEGAAKDVVGMEVGSEPQAAHRAINSNVPEP